ncbi:MAG: tetratricopeptide repeat protein [Bacteroidia bacterium]|nr:tetratricopeptide repeat protein [Bacteroidia bacterium]
MQDSAGRWTWQHFSLIAAGFLLFLGLLSVDRKVLTNNMKPAAVTVPSASATPQAKSDSIITRIPEFIASSEQQTVYKAFLQKWERYSELDESSKIRLIQEFAAFFVGSDRPDCAALLQEKLWEEHHIELPKLAIRFMDSYQLPKIAQDSLLYRYFNQHTIDYASLAAAELSGNEKDNFMVIKWVAMAKSENPTIVMQGIKELAAFGDKHPEHFQANLELSIFSYQTNQYEKALKRCQQAIQADARQAIAYFWLGNIYKALGNTEQAKLAWQKATTLHPAPELAQQINQQIQSI